MQSHNSIQGKNQSNLSPSSSMYQTEFDFGDDSYFFENPLSKKREPNFNSLKRSNLDFTNEHEKHNRNEPVSQSVPSLSTLNAERYKRKLEKEDTFSVRSKQTHNSLHLTPRQTMEDSVFKSTNQYSYFNTTENTSTPTEKNNIAHDRDYRFYNSSHEPLRVAHVPLRSNVANEYFSKTKRQASRTSVDIDNHTLQEKMLSKDIDTPNVDENNTKIHRDKQPIRKTEGMSAHSSNLTENFRSLNELHTLSENDDNSEDNSFSFHDDLVKDTSNEYQPAPVKKDVVLFQNIPLHAKEQLYAIASSIFNRLLTSLSKFLHAKVEHLSTVDSFSIDMLSELFSFRKCEFYIELLREINELTSSTDGLILLLIFVMDWLPSRCIASNVKNRIWKLHPIKNWATFLKNKEEFMNEKQSKFSFNSWISPDEMKSTIKLSSNFIDLSSSTFSGNKKRAPESKKKPPLIFQIFEIISLIVNADILSIALRSFEISLLQDSGYMDGLDSAEEEENRSSHNSNSPEENSYVSVRTIFSHIVNTSLSIAQFHWTNVPSIDDASTDIMQLFGKKSLYQWIYVLRRISILDFSYLVPRICKSFMNCGIEEKCHLLELLRFIDIRVDSENNIQALEKYIDLLLNSIHECIPQLGDSKKKKKKASSSQNVPLYLVSLLQAMNTIYSQISFQHQQLPESVHKKTESMLDMLLSLATHRDTSIKESICKTISTILAHASIELFNRRAEEFLLILNRLQSSSSISESSMWYYECMLRLLEDKENININLRFSDFFSLSDQNLDRYPEFTILIYAESNKILSNSAEDAKVNFMDGKQLFPSRNSKNQYHSIQKKMFHDISEELLHSKRSIFNGSILSEIGFEFKLFQLSHLIVRMAIISVEYVVHTLLSEFMRVIESQKQPEVLILGLRVLRLLVCISDRSKVEDITSLTPQVLHDLRVLHRFPNYKRLVKEIIRKNFSNVQNIIDFCDKKLGIDANNLQTPTPVTSFLNPIRVEDIYPITSSEAIWKRSAKNEKHSLSFFYKTQNAIDLVREQANIDDTSTVLTELDIVPQAIATSREESTSRIKLILERNSGSHLIREPISTTTTATTTTVVKKKSKKDKKQGKAKSLPSTDDQTLIFRLYLEAYRCIPYVVPEQLIKTVDPAHFIGTRIVCSDPLIATACSQSLQRIFYERSDLRPYIIEGCVMLLHLDYISSSEAALITVLDNITLMLEFWSSINRKEIADLFKDIQQTNEQIIGHVKATKWNAKKHWIEKVETNAVACLASPNLKLRHSALSVLESISHFIESERIDSIPNIEKYWNLRPTFYKVVKHCEKRIILSALQHLEIENNDYLAAHKTDPTSWEDELEFLTIQSISQSNDFQILWYLILVELVQCCQEANYSDFVLPLLEVLRKKSEMLLGCTQDANCDNHAIAFHLRNVLSMFFSGAGSETSMNLQSIHSELRNLLNGGLDISLWKKFATDGSSLLRKSLLDSISMIHPDSIEILMDSLCQWQEQSTTNASARDSRESQLSSKCFAMGLVSRICYRMAMHNRRLLNFNLHSFKILFNSLRTHIESVDFQTIDNPDLLLQVTSYILDYCNAIYYFYMHIHDIDASEDMIESFWEENALSSTIAFLQNASTFGMIPIVRKLSDQLEHLLATPPARSKKNRVDRIPENIANLTRMRFGTLKQHIVLGSQLAISYLVQSHRLPSLESEDDLQQYLKWFQEAELRGFHVLSSLLRNHLPTLLDTYLEFIYTSSNPSITTLYLLAIKRVLLSPSMEAFSHSSPIVTIRRAVRFLERQHSLRSSSSNLSKMSSLLLESPDLKIKLLHAILWSCFHFEESVHYHAFEMICDFVQLFTCSTKSEWESSNAYMNLQLFRASFKTRSARSLSNNAQQLSKMLSTLFLDSTLRLFEEAVLWYDKTFGPPGQLWIFSLLAPWCGGILITSGAESYEIITPLVHMTQTLQHRFPFTDNIRQLWVILGSAYNKVSSSLSNLEYIIQYLKQECQREDDFKWLSACREVILALFSAFPRETLSLLLRELKQTKFANEDVQISIDIEHENSSPHKAGDLETPSRQVPYINQMMKLRKSIILLVSDIICEAEHVEEIYEHIPVLFTFIICYFDEIHLREADFRKLLLNLLLRMKLTNEETSIAWEILCIQLSKQGDIQLNWNRNHQSFYSSVRKSVENSEFEESSKKLLPLFADEIFVMDLIQTFQKCVSESLSPKIADAMSDHALTSALHAHDPKENYRYLMIYHSSKKSYSPNHLRSIVQNLVRSCEITEISLSEDSQFHLATKCIQVLMQTLKQFAIHYYEASVLHTQDCIFWVAVCMMNYPLNDIYAECLDILLLFTKEERSRKKFMNISALFNDSHFFSNWLRPFTGLAILLVNGVNRSHFENKTMKVLFEAAKNTSEVTGQEEPFFVENSLTTFIVFLVWIHRHDSRSIVLGDDLHPQDACETMSKFASIVAPNSKLAETLTYSTFKRSKVMFMTNVSAQISLLFFPSHTKQAVDILQCMLAGQKRNLLPVIEVIKYIYLHAPQDSVHLFTSLIINAIQISSKDNLNEFVNGEIQTSSLIKQSVVELLNAVASRNTAQAVESPIHSEEASFSLPRVDYVGIGADLLEILKSFTVDEQPDDSQDAIEYNESDEEIDATQRFMNHPPESNQEMNPRDVILQDDENSQQRRHPSSISFPSLARAAVSVNQVRNHAAKRSSSAHISIPKYSYSGSPRFETEHQSPIASQEIENRADFDNSDALSPILNDSVSTLMRSFSSLEGLSITMSPSRKAPVPPQHNPPPQLRPAPQPFSIPKRVEEILNDDKSYSYFKGFSIDEQCKPTLFEFYEEIKNFMNQTNLSLRAGFANEIVSKFLSFDSPYFIEGLPGSIRSKILQDFNRNPQTPTKFLFSSAVDWIISVFEMYVDAFLNSEASASLHEM